MKISQLKENPNNPRTITKLKFNKLIESIKSFPEMMAKRPIVCITDSDGKLYPLGGNMRLKAVKAIGYEDIPKEWIVLADEWTEKQRKEFVIKDNVPFGEWDWDALANEWNAKDLSDWGLDVWQSDADTEVDLWEGKDDAESSAVSEDKMEFYNSMLNDCLYESDNEFDIPNLLLERQAGKLILPLAPYGADSRLRKGIATYHFYVEDYRFEAIWKDPTKVLESGVQAIVEPNLSLFDTTPIAYGLQQIYKKRWISRYFQECGIKVYVDLNVSIKFKEFNKMGIPNGYNAFFTRGYTERLAYLKEELEIARSISGKKIPNMIVYGGSEEIKQFCMANSLLYVKDFINAKKEEDGKD